MCWENQNGDRHNSFISHMIEFIRITLEILVEAGGLHMDSP